MDSQPHPLLHFLVRMKLTPRMSFFRSPKMWKSQGERFGLYGGCWSVSQSNLWSLSLTILAICGQELPYKRVIPSNSIPGCFDFMAHHTTLSHQETNHTLHSAHLQSNKETTVWTCTFSLCMSPTPKMAVSIRNNSVASFCKECVLWWVFGFHLTAPHIYHHHLQSVLPKGRSFTANAGIMAAVLHKGRSSTVNSGTKATVY